MNRIVLAYCHDNAELADSVEQQLSRIGIPFEQITDRTDDEPGDFCNRLQSAEDPAILFVTDNFFKSRACMSGVLPALQTLLRDGRLLIVVADGKVSHDEGATFEPVETHFDRMVHALQYMNYWQTAWLGLSDRYQHSEGEAKAALEADLNATRNIANEIGELISVLRESGYVTWEQFVAEDFALFFRHFGLQEWHTQYRQLTNITYIPQDTTPPIPQSAPQKELAEMPVINGALIPEPAEIASVGESAPMSSGWAEEDLNFSMEQISAEEEPSGNGHLNGMDITTREIEIEEKAQSTAGFTQADPDLDHVEFVSPEAEEIDLQNAEAQIEQAIRDAWFWIDKGHTERGLELLQFTVEQYPENERIRQELEHAQAKINPQSEAVISEPGVPDETPPIDNPPPSTLHPLPAVDENEAKSYDLMGDMAAEKGDYLFAKY
ncbi:MAG TPA: hypothetical protein PK228_20080, partial [Saprospiraceae bacterium]|nr:hypothetical protein [Saprospiraceae bacterium]